MSRISSLDAGYVGGALSLFPQAKDDKDQLYTAANNAEVTLRHSLTYGGKYIVVEDTSAFPSTGLLRLWTKDAKDAELVYYGRKTATTFSNLIRGFAGSRQNSWPASITYVSNSVMAEHHNAVKDALLNIEQYLGTETAPASTSINGILKALEVKHLAPKPLFRAYPTRGIPSLTVRFQNFTSPNAVRFLWDFGDGTTSAERNPVHTYAEEGVYTVKLNVITTTGAQGIVTKSNYITVSNEEGEPFFYIERLVIAAEDYSQATADSLGATAQTFRFVDQSDGLIRQRYWVFGDGQTATVTDPNSHVIDHIYQQPGSYEPSLMLVFNNERVKTVTLGTTITVK